MILAYFYSAQLHRYQVCVPDPIFKVHLRRCEYLESDDFGRLFVTFSPNDNGLALPDPRLLALHAACARVTHMSGVAEAFNEVECDVEDTRVLAYDGSSAHLLDHLLTPFVAIPGVVLRGSPLSPEHRADG